MRAALALRPPVLKELRPVPAERILISTRVYDQARAAASTFVEPTLSGDLGPEFEGAVGAVPAGGRS